MIRFFSVLCVCLLFFQSEAQRPKLVLQTGNTGRVNLLDITFDSKYVANAYGSETVLLWDVNKEKILNNYRYDGRVTDLSFSPTSHLLLASTTTGGIYGMQFQGPENHFKIEAHSKAVNAIALTPDGKILVSCSQDSSISLWDLESQTLKTRIKGKYNPFTTVTIHPNEPIIYAGDQFGNLLIYNYDSNEEEYYNTISPEGIRQLKVWKDSYLLVADLKGALHVITPEPVSIKQTFSPFDKTAFSLSVRDDLLIATGRDSQKNVVFYRRLPGDSIARESTDFIQQNTAAQAFQFGIYAHAQNSDGILALPNTKNEIEIYDIYKGKNLKTLKGIASPVQAVTFSETSLIYASNNAIGKHDLMGSSPIVLSKTKEPINKLFKLSDQRLLGYSENSSLLNILPSTMDVDAAESLPKTTSALELDFLEDKQLLIFKEDEKKVYVKSWRTGKRKKLGIKNCRRIETSGNENVIAFLTDNTIEIYTGEQKPKSINTFPVQQTGPFTINKEGDLLVYYDNTVGSKKIIGKGVYTKNTTFSIPVSDSIVIDRMTFSPTGTMLFTWARSVGKFNKREDYSIKVWDLEEQKLVTQLDSHNGFINHLTFSPDNKWVVSSGMDGTIRFWSAQSLIEKLLIIPLDNGEWVAITPNGRFDASPQAMPEIHFIFKNQVLQLDQMKRNFYEPKLTQKILGYLDRPFLTDLTNKSYTLFPQINFISDVNMDGILKIALTDQGGGIGRTTLSINNKETVHDIRELSTYDSVSHEFTYEIKNHPFLSAGGLNKITIEAFNTYGYKISNKKNVFYVDGRSENELNDANLYALVIGISDYAGEELDLNFAAKDARDFAQALQLGAEEFLGIEKVHISTLSTDKNNTSPTVKNISQKLEDIAQQAKPNDILLIFMAGHGMNLEGDDEFYFLTQGAEQHLVEDEKIDEVSISSSDLVQMTKRISALKQLLIVDACHSGNLVNSSFNQEGHLNDESIKALEFLKDRTGMFVLASSEGEEVSFESSILNQGLLTYSLLFGLKGAGLYDGELVDAANLLRYALRKVPSLAKDIGESQQPVVKMPADFSSFQFGKLSAKKRKEILIEPPKPVVIRSHFHKKETLYDEEHISEQLDEKIRLLRNHVKHDYIFIEENHFSNAYTVYGQYYFNKGTYTIEYKIFHDDTPVFESELKSSSLNNILDEIALQLVNIIAE